MKTIVITGGTDGMGAALARHYLDAGDRVVVIGRSREKFEELVSGSAGAQAKRRATFVTADLSLVSETVHTVNELKNLLDRVDGLVLAASFIRPHRFETSEGHEASWSLFFLSKYLLVMGLADLLRAARRPVVVNTAVPGAAPDALNLDDLELVEGFSLRRSNAQQRRANELLGILATKRNPHLSYITWGPARLVRTSFAGDLGIGMRIMSATLGRAIGQRPEDAVQPLIELLDTPVSGRRAIRGTRPVPLNSSVEEDNAAAALDVAVAKSLLRPFKSRLSS